MILNKFIRENIELVKSALKDRQIKDYDKIIDELLLTDKQYRSNLEFLESLKNKRNLISKELSTIDKKSNNFKIKSKEVLNLKEEIKTLEEDLVKLKERNNNLILLLPNIPDSTVPIGKNENSNKEIKKAGVIKKFNFIAKSHDDIGLSLGGIDFETAAKISGARFVILKKSFALLERALINFMIDTHTNENGYTEYSVPVIVNSESMYNTGQLPKFKSEQYTLEDDLWLIPTSEVPLTNIFANVVLNYDNLPLRLVSCTNCFRKEAGAAGKDTKGIIRQHQFSKVELVSIIQPEKRFQELERLVSCAEKILTKLELPFRLMSLSTGDLGFSAEKTYDIEVWLPSQNKYREISSCSSCGTFQSARMKARYKDINGKNELVATLNGSGLAVGRTIVAILENYQNSDGSVTIPNILKPYMKGKEKLL
ncbi:MAG: serine--tRNA ligase [Candidatus Pelagibacter sp.]|nr:serine--tRNA ligase [Candidatus Pelagibacter sp.]